MMIRPCQPSDEAAIRQICFDTALFGNSMRGFIDDIELITESIIGYHIRYEPESLLVAEDQGLVAGYLSGCRDTRRFERIYARKILPRVLLRFFSQGHWRKRNAWRLVLFGMRSAPQWKALHQTVSADYPAHLHCNVKPGMQGRGIGAALMDAFIGGLTARRVSGVHLTTATDAGKAFFARCGFQTLARRSMPSLAGYPPQEVWLMVRKCAPAP